MNKDVKFEEDFPPKKSHEPVLVEELETPKVEAMSTMTFRVVQ